jgi:hypothetical protein
VAERMDIQVPIFRPRLPEWDTWLWEHRRTRELTQRAWALHRGFRMRHCLLYWRHFMLRNKRMRVAWVGAASNQVRARLGLC